MSRKLLLGLAVAIALGVTGLALFGFKGLRHERRLRAEAETLSEQNQILEGQNQRLAEEARLLKDNDAYIEKVARDQLGLIRPGEKIYLVPTKGAQAQ